jgi:hypothetical protein
LHYYINSMNNQRNNDLVLEPTYSNLIYKVCYLLSITSFYGFYRKKYDTACILFCGFLTSINYWHYPTFGLRRRLDMTAIPIGLLYHALRAYNSQYYCAYYALNVACVLFYPASCYYYNKRQYWTSTYLHCMVHLIGNTSFIVLYSGSLLPFSKNPFFSRIKNI